MDHPPTLADPGRALGVRWPELIVALGLLGLGLVVVKDSLRVGAGWAEDGPQSGYFPFYIGLMLSASAAFIALRQLMHWSGTREAFAEHSQLKSVASIAWPMLVYIALIKPLGIYVASFLLITWFMKRHGSWGWPAVLALAVGVPLVFFVVFEKWFLVLLPKGPLEAALGL
jgi:putative tricarboxylic transport membrane protein